MLNYFNIDMSVGLCIGVMIGAGFAFRILAYMVFRNKMRPVKAMTDKPKKKFCSCCRRSQGIDSPDTPKKSAEKKIDFDEEQRIEVI